MGTENKANNSTYFIGEDGLRYCSVCGKPKQKKFEGVPGKDWICGIGCACDTARKEEDDRRDALEKIEMIRRDTFHGSQLADCTFDKDDLKAPEYSQMAKDAAKELEEGIRKWILFTGGTGVGKTFLTACICNYLIDLGSTVHFTSIFAIERRLWRAEDKDEIYRSLNSYDILVIDDLGAERDTEYINGIVYDVINMRYESDKPMIITTNIPAADLISPPNPAKKRIYSRIAEKSVVIEMEGKDRRLSTLRKNMEEFTGVCENDRTDPGSEE